MTMRGLDAAAQLLGRAVLPLLFVTAACQADTQTERPMAAGERVLNLFVWSPHPPTVGGMGSADHYLAEGTIEGFEKATGIQVKVVNYATDEEMGRQLAEGAAWADLIIPSDSAYPDPIARGYFRKLDRNLIPRLSNVDPAIARKAAVSDPENAHSVVHMWGAVAIGFDPAKVRTLVADDPTVSWKRFLDPSVLKALRSCGVMLPGYPDEAYSVALLALGRSPDSTDPTDIDAATDLLSRVAPYVQFGFPEARDLQSGKLCAAAGYGGQMRSAPTSPSSREIRIVIPREGSRMWFDSYLVPANAPHSANAHAFIDYMLDPKVSASTTNHTGYGTINRLAAPHIAADRRHAPDVAPSPEGVERLVPTSPAAVKARASLVEAGWKKIAAAQ